MTIALQSGIQSYRVFSQKQWDLVTLFLYIHVTYGASLNNQVGMCLI